MSDDETVTLDEVDLVIVAELQRDGRVTTQALAKRVGISEVTARKRLRRLQLDGTVRIVAVVDPFQVGVGSPAFVGVKVEQRSRIEEIARALAEHPKVRYVAASTGPAHLIVEVMARSNRELSAFLLEDLSQIDGILDTETSVVLKVFKQSWVFEGRGATTVSDEPRAQDR
jgi:Lrp/AsnC family transcriptional regulator for asnA, asnC and gidA